MPTPRVSIVTDSTSHLPDGLADELGVAVVPLQVSLGDRNLLDGVDLRPGELAAWLAVPGHTATTSQPSPESLRAAYESAPTRDVLAVHLSAALSGTVSSAQAVAAELTGRRVRVVDARSAAMGLGFAVLAAAEAARAGGDLDAVAAAAEATVPRTRMLFYVDTLEHLRRGGRIGAARAWLGSHLSVKPLLHVVDGAIAPLEKVRTASRGIARLQELAIAEAGDGPVDVAVHHLAAPERAAAVAEALRAGLPSLGRLYESEVGAVIGAHAGPGLLGIVIHHI